MTPLPSVPLSLHPDVLSRHRGRDQTGAPLPDPVVMTMSTAVASARDAAERLLALARANSADQSRPAPIRAAQTRQTALDLGERHARALEAARERAAATIRQIEAETLPPPPRDGLVAQEVRARLAGMSREDRGRIISDAVASGDGLVIGALMAAPAFLSSLDGPQAALVASRWRQAHSPDEAARIQRLGLAVEDMGRAAGAWSGLVEQLAADPEAKKAEAATIAASQALRAAQETRE